MRLQLIMLETPIIVSDETPEVEDIVFLGNSYNYISKVINMIGGSLRDVVLEKMPEQRKNGTLDYREMSKIIAGISKLPSINFHNLSEEDWKRIGLIDVKKLAEKETIKSKASAWIYNQLSESPSEDNEFCAQTAEDFWVDGFKAAQQLNEKKFSLEDMANLWQYIVDGAKQLMLSGTTEVSSFENYIQLLQQPKIFDIEVEMEEAEEYDIVYGHKDKFPRPLITNSQIKITKIL